MPGPRPGRRSPGHRPPPRAPRPWPPPPVAALRSPRRPSRCSPIEDLVGNVDAGPRLVEWLRLSLDQPELLTRLGGSARLGVLVTGPEGVGKLTLARSAAAAVSAQCVELVAPGVAALEAAAAGQRVHEVITAAQAAARAGQRTVLVVTDVDALLPAADPPPLATLVLDALRAAVNTPGMALVATSAAPESVDPRLRVAGPGGPRAAAAAARRAGPDRAAAPAAGRGAAGRRGRPARGRRAGSRVRGRRPGRGAPGGGRAGRAAALRRPAGRRPAPADEPAVDNRRPPSGHRAADQPDPEPRICQQDLLDAVGSIRPISMSSSATLQTGGITLDEVGDMTEVKQALTEAVLWPLQYPDSFARLGVAPPRGVLIYGPPGCGKTFLLRALAGTGQLNVFAVKGAELLDKYVGESERAVRELFRRASDAAPALVFLDEVDALAPRRGQSTDSGVADRVVAALLTELDGAEPLREVIVVGATNRPELIDPALLRPGRLERLIYVPPPDGRPAPTSCGWPGGTPRWPTTSTWSSWAPSWRATRRPTARRCCARRR